VLEELWIGGGLLVLEDAKLEGGAEDTGGIMIAPAPATWQEPTMFPK